MSAHPKSVVHCVRSDSFAGVERYVATVAPELARRGWDVAVIGGDPDRMSAELGPLHHAPAATTFRAATQLLGRDRHTIVHTHMTAAEMAAVAARVVRRFPLVTTRHFAATRGATVAGRAGARLIVRSVDRQIAISQFVAAAIGEPSIVLLNGVPNNNRPRAPERIVLVAQRLEPEKCTDVAIRAWAQSSLRGAGWRLTVAGRGRQQPELTQLVQRLGLHDSIDFVGMQSDLAQLMSRAGIFLATAPAEPFGLTIVEAMAAGLPVVAAFGGAHVETIGGASDRWLFPAGDAQAAATMLDSLGADPEERERVGAREQEWQRAHLSIESHVDQLEKIYADVRR